MVFSLASTGSPELTQIGPCYVSPDSNSTYLNEWAWNQEVNMLFIDQPNQVGLGYDVLRNGTYNLADSSGRITYNDFVNGVPEQSSALLIGTFPSQEEWASANTTENAARALWHFSQVWLTTFPQYKPKDDRISLWTESYGGHYGPAFFNFFREQNAKIANGTWNDAGETYQMHLDTLGIINGCVDELIQGLSYPTMAYNNTYDIKAIDRTEYDNIIYYWSRAGGLRELVQTCRDLAAEGDPMNRGNNATVNAACSEANMATAYVETPYASSGRSYYDIAAVSLDPFPRNFYVGYLNQPHVQKALGVPVNFTNNGCNGPCAAFQKTGDYVRGGFVEDIGQLLDAGIKVHLVYGDRDYACSWFGGEAISLAVQYSNMDQFARAGYANVLINSSYIGGLVRQYGNFSFTRVFQAGHEVPSYQPQTAYEIFRRALFNFDIATGQIPIAQEDKYSTIGVADTWAVTQTAPEAEHPFCYTYALTSTCDDEQIRAVLNGSAMIRNYIVVDDYTSTLFPELAGEAQNNSGGHNADEDSGGDKNLAVGSNRSWKANVMVLILTSALLLL
jgi:carboxypeptidase C (cathepsin A)